MRRSRARLSALLAPLLALALAAAPEVGAAAAATELGDEAPLMRVGSPGRTLLSRIQAGWLAWLSAINAADETEARAAVGRMQAYAAQVGTPHLPELSLAASARALEAAAAGEMDRARWALEAAETLDPGRADTAFAAAAVARADGAWGAWVAETARAYLRTLLDSELRERLGFSVLSWLHAVLLFSLLAFAGVLMAVKGGWLYRDLVRALSRFLPRPLTHPLVWVVLAWPLAMPAGPLWLALYWGILLWGHSGVVERVAVVATWVLLAVSPGLAALQEERLDRLGHSGLRTLEAAAEGRLYGSLLTDVAQLESRLPESVALQHALGDLERRLGECQMARVFYGSVLSSEPRNAAALADLGLCSYEAGSYERAIQYFQLAAESGRPRAQVEFNLSQAYSELYRFNEAESALRAARAIDSAAVNEWIQSGDPRLILPVDGGLERTGEIARELESERALAEAGSRLLAAGRRTATLGLAFVAAALLLRYALGAAPRRPAKPAGRWFPGPAELARRVLLLGVPEGEADRWGRALLALTTVAALASLPWAERVGFPGPWGIVPEAGLRLVVAVAGLTLFFVRRFLEQRNARL